MKKVVKTVFIAMSGGVDSSVAAMLLQKQGYAVIGAHIRCFNVDGCAERDAEDARRVAEQLHIPFYVFDFEKEYRAQVVHYMVKGYKEGVTPNPDVMCNKEIKFGLFLKRALELGADYIATGHYVRLGNIMYASSFSLLEAKDINKDQSYFLWTLTQAQLKHCLFPIGEYTKPQVRALAQKYGLLTAQKKDSQGICFLGQVTLADFLNDYIPAQRGAVLTTAGETIGEHNGAHFYTIGQRHGFKIKKREAGNGKREKYDTQPHYIINKNITSNTLVVAEGNTNPALYKKEITITGVNFINPLPLKTANYKLRARIRYRQPLAPAIIKFTTSQVVRLIFKKPQKFVAPGQSAVFYNKRGEMLGGGIIQ